MSRGGRRVAIWILGLGLIASAAVAAVGLLLSRADDGDDTATGTDTIDVPAMDGPTGAAAQVPRERLLVMASSHLPPDGEITYDPGNTVDGDPTTAWNSDAPGTDGRGQVLTYRFTEPVDLRAIRIVNGYAKNPDIFAANHRLREVEVRTDAGAQRVSLLDTDEQQEITFDFGLTSKVVLEVVDVYTGDGFANPDLTADLALSEIGFVAIQR